MLFLRKQIYEYKYKYVSIIFIKVYLFIQFFSFHHKKLKIFSFCLEGFLYRFYYNPFILIAF
jgi:hypothetical protein